MTSSNKRKSIIFDLDTGKKAKIQRVPRNVQYSNAVQDDEPEEQWISYMQPEILSLPFMIELLGKHQVRSSSLAGKGKDEIVKLFLKYVTSKPQREYSPNRVGKALTLNQKKNATNVTPEWHNMVQHSSKGMTIKKHKSSNLSSLIPTPAGSDRLKPPVQSLINTTRKTIKLSSSTSKVALPKTAALPKTTVVVASSPKKTATVIASIKSSLDDIDSILKARSKKTDAACSNDKKSANTPKRVISLNKNTAEPSPKTAKIDTSSNQKDKEAKPSSESRRHASVNWP